MWGCSTPQSVIQSTIDNVIRYDTIRVALPQETVFDTVYINNGQGESVKYIVRTDSVRVYIRGKEKIIYVPVTDTITVTKTEIKTVESDDLTIKEMFLWATGIIGMVLLIQLLKR
jgi:hypothetical protein